MSPDSDLNPPTSARRSASFLKHAQAPREFSVGKFAVLAAVLFAAVSGVVTLLILR